MSPARVARVVSVPVALGLSLAMLLGIAAVGARLPGLSVLSGVPQLRALDYSVDRFGRLAPLNDRFVLGALGSGAAAQGLGFDAGREQAPPAAGPSSRPTPPEETPEGGNNLVNVAPKLRVEFAVDKSRASPGDTITYVIKVMNEGRAAAHDVTILSHIPEHTSYYPESDCGKAVCTGTRSDGTPFVATYTAAPCPPVVQHCYNNSGNKIEPGQVLKDSFSVVVDADAPEAVLRNHAHVEAGGGTRITSNEVRTEVRRAQ